MKQLVITSEAKRAALERALAAHIAAIDTERRQTKRNSRRDKLDASRRLFRQVADEGGNHGTHHEG